MYCVAMKASALENDSIPSWQLGVSKWTGAGYALPEPVRSSAASTARDDASPNPSQGNVAGGLPYTMPVDPRASSANNTPQYEMPLTVPIDLSSTESYSSHPYQNVPAWASAAPTAPTEPANSATADSSLEPLPANVSVDEAAPAAAREQPSASIAEPLSSPSTGESPPLESEVMRWYQYPQRWMRGWDSHAEFGLDGSNGNADTLALQTGLEMKRKSERSTLALDVDYRQASSRNAIIEDNGRFNIDYDYLFADSPWSGFAKYGMEWDKFKAFDLRLNLNGGIGYFWIRDDTTTFVTRFGAGASKEIGAPVDDWIPEAVFGMEAERQLTSRQKVKGKVDYFPAWENFDDYRLVTDLAWEILLDGSENLSLKLAATDRYDSTPQGARPNDLYYSLLLLYKF